MKLSSQMRAEIDTTIMRVVQLAQEFHMIKPVPGQRYSVRESMTRNMEELKTHKIRMENR